MEQSFHHADHKQSIGKQAVIFLSGANGVGKNTFFNNCLKPLGGSLVVRDLVGVPKKGEIAGVHYHFIYDREFLRKLKNNEYLFAAKQVYSRGRGITFAAFNQTRISGKYPVIIGGPTTYHKIFAALKQHHPNFQLLNIYLLPPTFHIWLDRLTQRAKGDVIEAAKLVEKLENSVNMLERIAQQEFIFDLVVVNDNLGNLKNYQKRLALSGLLL